MINRIFSTIILCLIILIIPFKLGINGSIILFTLITFIAQIEFYNLLNKSKLEPKCYLGSSFGSLIILSSWYIPEYNKMLNHDVGSEVLAIAVIVISLFFLKNPSLREIEISMMPTFIVIIFIPFMLHYYVLLFRHYYDLGIPITGYITIFWLIAVSKSTDIGSLLIGKILGNKKLSIKISPQKTIEGAIGGVILSSIIGSLIAFYFSQYMPNKFSPIISIIVSIPISIISIGSDLIESMFKRQAGVKDSGQIIPGIGGIFDLIDSLLLTAPLGFLFFKYIL